MLRGVTLVCVLAGASTAVAQPSAVDPTTPADADATRVPGFATLDRGDDTSRIGVEASYSFFGDNGGQGGPWRFEGHAQYFSPTSNFGGYVQFPFTSYEGTSGGDLELGAVYVPKLRVPGLRVVLREGIALPTADENWGGLWTAPSRLTDYYLTLPDATSMRFSASVLWRSGIAFARADLGVDLNLAINWPVIGGSPEPGFGDPSDTLVRANLGFGVELLNRLSLTAELTTLYDNDIQSSGEFQANLLATGAVAARVRIGSMDVYAALVVPLDDGVREIIDPNFVGCPGPLPVFRSALTFGVEQRFE